MEKKQKTSYRPLFTIDQTCTHKYYHSIMKNYVGIITLSVVISLCYRFNDIFIIYISENRNTSMQEKKSATILTTIWRFSGCSVSKCDDMLLVLVLVWRRLWGFCKTSPISTRYDVRVGGPGCSVSHAVVLPARHLSRYEKLLTSAPRVSSLTSSRPRCRSHLSS